MSNELSASAGSHSEKKEILPIYIKRPAADGSGPPTLAPASSAVHLAAAWCSGTGRSLHRFQARPSMTRVARHRECG